MKAIVLKEIDGVDNLVFEDIAKPSIKDDEVLVQVKAISINPIDYVVRDNKDLRNFILRLQGDEQQIVLGWDVSGIVVATGNLVAQFKVGDEVFGGIRFPGHGKAYAEYVAAPAMDLACKPAFVKFEEAAAATMAALTAYQSIISYANVKVGDKVLIHAAAGGVGHYAVQIAKHLGAYVIGTASEANRDFVLGLGADEFIDYKSQPFETIVSDADVVLDSVMVMDTTHIERSLKTLKHGGRLISLLAFFDEAFTEKMRAKNVFGHRLSVQSNGAQMAVIAEWLEKGILTSHISRRFSLEEIGAAHLQIQTGKTKGKIVILL